MNYTSILNKRSLCFLIPGIFVSFIVMAQPDISGKANMDGREKNLNITPFGIVKSWYKIADPLGKTIGYKDFNIVMPLLILQTLEYSGGMHVIYKELKLFMILR